MPGFEETPHSVDRVEGCRERVLEVYPGARVRVLPEGRFERNRARHVVEDFLQDAELSRYDSIFCCNDDMALGVFAAVCAHFRERGEPFPLSIAGFNNTDEFRSVQAVDPFGCLAGSVDHTPWRVHRSRIPCP